MPGTSKWPEMGPTERELAALAESQGNEEQKQQLANNTSEASSSGLGDVVEAVDAGASILSWIFELFS